MYKTISNWRLDVEWWSPRWWTLGFMVSLDSFYLHLLPLSVQIYRLVELDDAS